MRKSDPQLKIRLPVDVKDFIESEARENASSQSSEIVRAVRAVMRERALNSITKEGDHAPNAR